MPCPVKSAEAADAGAAGVSAADAASADTSARSGASTCGVVSAALGGPEIVLLAGTCGIMIVDLHVKSERRIASFRLASYTVWPFGRAVVARPTAGGLSFLGNVIWFFLGGVWMALAHLVVGLLLCITIIGIPFGIQAFKLIPVVLMPFGADVVSDRAGRAAPAVA